MYTLTRGRTRWHLEMLAAAKNRKKARVAAPRVQVMSRVQLLGSPPRLTDWRAGHLATDLCCEVGCACGVPRGGGRVHVKPSLPPSQGRAIPSHFMCSLLRGLLRTQALEHGRVRASQNFENFLIKFGGAQISRNLRRNLGVWPDFTLGLKILQVSPFKFRTSLTESA